MLALIACQGSGDAPVPSADPAPATSAPEDEVTYVPAYPEDVSDEGLSDEDVAQQEAHSHGEEEHSHGEEDHSHNEEDHSHDEEDHGHGEGEHSHGEGEDHDH